MVENGDECTRHKGNDRCVHGVFMYTWSVQCGVVCEQTAEGRHVRGQRRPQEVGHPGPYESVRVGEHSSRVSGRGNTWTGCFTKCFSCGLEKPLSGSYSIASM